MRKRDLSCAFKGAYYGLYHMQSDYRYSVKKVWRYFYSIFAVLAAMIVYMFIV